MGVSGRKLQIKDENDAQRLRCPNGHASVGPTNNHWWCRSCANAWDVDPEYDTIQDVKTGRELRREDVEIDDSVSGCYYA